jgi:hypothetical protein
MVHDFKRSLTTKNCITVTRQAADFTIGLLEPEWQPCVSGKIFRGTAKTGAQASGVGFLKCYEVEVSKSIRDGVEVSPALGMRKKVLPAMQQVVGVSPRRHSGLYVVIQQAKVLAIRRPCVRIFFGMSQ